MREAPSNAGSASWGVTSKSLRFSAGVVGAPLPPRAEASTLGIFTMSPFYAFMPVAGVFLWLYRVVVAVGVAVVVRGDVLVGDLLAINVGAGDVAYSRFFCSGVGMTALMDMRHKPVLMPSERTYS